MKNWIRKILGIDVMDKAIKDKNSSTQSKLVNISKLLEANLDTSSKLDNISKLLENQQKDEPPKLPETISEITFCNKSDSINFNLENDLQLDENWVLLNSKNNAHNIFSQAMATSSLAASTGYSTSGLYTATASANSLMTYGNGSLSSITMNGSRFGEHAGFVSVNAAVFTPILAFQFASMITGQYYFKGLSKQLNFIHESLNELISLHHNERLAKLRYINFKITELHRRSFFTAEDYITIDTIKYDLSIIRFEYLLSAKQEIDRVLDVVKGNNASERIDVISEETNKLEKLKISTKEKIAKYSSIIQDKFNSLYQDSLIETGVVSIKKLTENSSKKAIKLTNEVIDSKYFFYSEISLKAEHLYQLSKLLELKMNLSDKEPDSNRIGKIKELYANISTFNLNESVFDEIENLNNQLRSKIVLDFNMLTEKSIVNKNEIIANGSKITDELNKTEDLIQRKHLLFGDIQEIKKGFEKPNQILIDNRSATIKIYSKAIV